MACNEPVVRRNFFNALKPTRLYVYEYSERIESSTPSLSFDTRLSLRFRSTRRLEQSLAEAVAAQRAQSSVEPVGRLFSVARADAAQHEMNMTLNRDFPGGDRDIKFYSAVISVSVDEVTQQTARALNESALRIERERLERSRLSAEARFLREEVFCDPASAQLYWIARNGIPLEAKILETLVKSVVEWSPKNQWVVLARLFQDLLEPYPRQGVIDLVRLLEIYFRDSGRVDLAKEVSQLLDGML